LIAAGQGNDITCGRAHVASAARAARRREWPRWRSIRCCDERRAAKLVSPVCAGDNGLGRPMHVFRRQHSTYLSSVPQVHCHSRQGFSGVLPFPKSAFTARYSAARLSSPLNPPSLANKGNSALQGIYANPLLHCRPLDPWHTQSLHSPPPPRPTAPPLHPRLPLPPSPLHPRAPARATTPFSCLPVLSATAVPPSRATGPR
jgi:hypothetical protein